MNTVLWSAAAAALVIAAPSSAQLLGGGGGLGGMAGGLGGSAGGMLGGSLGRDRIGVDAAAGTDGHVPRVRRNASPAALTATNVLGERRVAADQSATADLAIDQRFLRTRGAVAASQQGLRRAAATTTGVPVFVAPSAVAVTAGQGYPAYGRAYYYGPEAVYVEPAYVGPYVDRQQRDLETDLRGTGASVERRGDDLVVMLPADVTFAFDKSDVRPRFYGVLSAFARTLRTYRGSDVEVVGHTDAVGSDTYNLGLSERRGRTVADLLVRNDVEPTRLVVEAMGKAEPIASNATVAGRAANRRVELIVHTRSGAPMNE